MRDILILALIVVVPTLASAQPASRMGPPPGNTGAANNGVGTAGSLDRDAGSASSKATPSTIDTNGANSRVIGPKENDPALGGGAQTK